MLIGPHPLIAPFPCCKGANNANHRRWLLCPLRPPLWLLAGHSGFYGFDASKRTCVPIVSPQVSVGSDEGGQPQRDATKWEYGAATMNNKTFAGVYVGSCADDARTSWLLPDYFDFYVDFCQCNHTYRTYVLHQSTNRTSQQLVSSKSGCTPRTMMRTAKHPSQVADPRRVPLNRSVFVRSMRIENIHQVLTCKVQYASVHVRPYVRPPYVRSTWQTFHIRTVRTYVLLSSVLVRAHERVRLPVHHVCTS